MVYASQQRTETKGVEAKAIPEANDLDFSALLDPTLLKAARHIYRTYYEVHPEQARPLGVAIDRFTYRGKLIFSGRPILLPQECFVPLNQIESSLH